MEPEPRDKSDRRDFLRASAAAGLGMSLAGCRSDAADAPGDLRLGQIRLIDLSVPIEHDAAGRARPFARTGTRSAIAPLPICWRAT